MVLSLVKSEMGALTLIQLLHCRFSEPIRGTPVSQSQEVPLLHCTSMSENPVEYPESRYEIW
jgi:hypothetical protein